MFRTIFSYIAYTLNYLRITAIYAGLSCLFLDMISGNSIYIVVADEAYFISKPFVYIANNYGFNLEDVIKSFTCFIITLVILPFFTGKEWITAKIMISFLGMSVIKLIIAIINGSIILLKLPYILLEKKTTLDEKLAAFETIKNELLTNKPWLKEFEFSNIPNSILDVNNLQSFKLKVSMLLNEITPSTIGIKESSSSSVYLAIGIGVLVILTAIIIGLAIKTNINLSKLDDINGTINKHTQDINALKGDQSSINMQTNTVMNDNVNLNTASTKIQTASDHLNDDRFDRTRSNFEKIEGNQEILREKINELTTQANTALTRQEALNNKFAIELTKMEKNVNQIQNEMTHTETAINELDTKLVDNLNELGKKVQSIENIEEIKKALEIAQTLS